MNEIKENIFFIFVGILILFLSIALLVGSYFACSSLYTKYNVWRSGMAGKAELMQADWNRQIAIKEAEAKREASIALAQAEIERAKGVAQANKIIGDSLKGNEAYLRYLWIDSLQNDKNKIVYVPTEANLPILEASRFNESFNKKGNPDD